MGTQILGRNNSGFGITEILILLFGLAVLVIVGVGTGGGSASRSKASSCQENLSRIDGAKEQYALEYRQSTGAMVSMESLVDPEGRGPGTGYLRMAPVCPSGGVYQVRAIGEAPTCSLGAGGDAKHKLPN